MARKRGAHLADAGPRSTEEVVKRVSTWLADDANVQSLGAESRSATMEPSGSGT